MRDEELLGRPRYRVRYRESEGARLKSVETLGGDPPVRIDILGVPGIAFAAQKDGTRHLMDLETLEDVLIEQQDRYGYWHQVGRWLPRNPANAR